MDDNELKNLALMMTINCVRNTIIEEYHSEDKINQEEMKEFNIEVSNKIYTFLKYFMHESEKEREKLMLLMSMFSTNGWNQPEIDEDFKQALEFFNKYN